MDRSAQPERKRIITSLRRAGYHTKVEETGDLEFPLKLTFINKLDGKWTRIELDVSVRTIHRIIRKARQLRRRT